MKGRPLSCMATHLTAATLAILAALHVAWGRESAFPFSTRAALADAARAGIPDKLVTPRSVAGRLG